MRFMTDSPRGAASDRLFKPWKYLSHKVEIHQNLIFSTHQTQGRLLAMVICFCANEAVIRTSWTNTNPGRRFWSCAQSVSLLNCFLFHL